MSIDARPVSVCSHLLADDWPEHHIWFNGRGLEFHWVCEACRKLYPALPDNMVETPEAIDEDRGLCLGICGAPEVRTRPSAMHFAHDDFPSPCTNYGPWIGIEPNPSIEGEWIALFKSGEVVAINPRRGDSSRVCLLENLSFEMNENAKFVLSPSCDYIAVFESFGQKVCVIDFRTGAVSLSTDRGDYCARSCHTSVAFFEIDGRCLVVASTAWNRLDVFDASDGRLLTERSLPEDHRDKRYRDYFDGKLYVSPNGDWIVDDGWEWHPMGIIRSWSLRAWVHENAWESDDGPSVQHLPWRDHFWNGPVCWIDDSRIAVWGWGNDIDCIIPAIVIIDVKSGDRLRWFAGPETRPSGEAPFKITAPSLFFDRYLFSVSDERGTGVWDVDTGERLHMDPDFAPTHYHPGSREFLLVSANSIRLSRLILGE